MPVLIDVSYGVILSRFFPFISWTHSQIEGKIEITQESFDYLSTHFEDWNQ